jgi:DNA-binding SARP family transcriptional activator
VVPELIRAVAEHPTTERLAELLMLALYQSGRKAEALGAYVRIRASLDAELGIDPGVRLRELHLTILRDEPVPVGPLAQVP